MTLHSPRIACALVAAACLWSLAAPPARAVEQDADVVPVEAVIRSVKQALWVAQSELDTDELPPIHSAILQLETLHAPRRDGRSELIIAKAGTPFDRLRIQRLVLDLKPPRAPSSPVSAREAEQDLAQLVVSASRAAAFSESEPNPLSLNLATTHLRFVVLKAGAGGLGFAISPLTHDLDIAADQASAQVLTISFRPR